MPIAKKELLAQFQQNWKKYWDLQTLKDLDFKRQQCKSCRKFFWAQIQQEKCNDASCREYEFLGKPITKKKFDYFSAWKSARDFFVKNGHAELERYPTICRWFPLYFTIAGIVDFYRMSGSKFVFEFPKNPATVLQPSLRFNDIPQVGVSGRHWTCHSHIEQASIWDGKKGYWKEKCIELDFDLLTKVFGIKPEKINFIEDAWLGAGAFGYSLEYHVAGIELGNAVFTEFAGTPDKFETMKEKIIDMGAGLERFVWVSQGTPTSYDAVLGPVLKKFIKQGNVQYDEKFFLQYARMAGALNVDEAPNVEALRAEIARKLGVSKIELEEKIEPIQAIYAIADHSRCLLFALADGGIPSNVGGGYNLRVILRRALGFIDKYKFPFDVVDFSRDVAKFFKLQHPELLKNMERFEEIIRVEEKRYRGGMERIKKTVSSMIEKNENFSEEKIIELYDSHGITPEILTEVAGQRGIKLDIPMDLYARVTAKHEKEIPEKKDFGFSVEGLPETRTLYYEDMKVKKFSGKVIGFFNGKFVVLDKTLFYPRGGGQEPDHGTLGGKKVLDAEKIEGVIAHHVDGGNFKIGENVSGEIDWDRRYQITLHHDATHVINGACRKILGPWLWQAGSKKDSDKAHIDMTHYEALTPEQAEKIEELANSVCEKNLKIIKKIYPRQEAEKKFGFGIYQRASVPSAELRIVDIGGFDIEACGGTHGDDTKDISPIIITKVERPADGTIRLTYKAGPAARKYLEVVEKNLEEAAGILKVKREKIPAAAEKLVAEWKEKRKELEQMQRKIAQSSAEKMEFENLRGLRMLVREIFGADPKQLQEISLKLSGADTVIVLFGTTKEKVFVFGSAGATAVKAGINVEKIVAEACKELGGRGGGREGLAQGNGIATDKVKSLCSKIIEGLK